MKTDNSNIGKREFLKKCVTFSAGIVCLPCGISMADYFSDDQSIYRKVAMFQEETADTKCPSCGTVVVKRQGYRIVFNKIIKGNCSNCGKKVDGIWS